MLLPLYSKRKMGGKAMSTQQTFWDLLKRYSIEIPIIQRDYAQGRTDKRSTQIRQSFIHTLEKTISNEDESQDLDFIYGTVIDDKLILLDGQQRLTTLFLLHCYIASITDNMDTSVRDRLKKFTYKTRVTSREFCQSLIENNCSTADLKPTEAFSTTLADASWFFSIWNADPTIQSMLVMLDEIHNVFKKTDHSKLWTLLTSKDNPPVTFHFLDMNTFKLTDELYIKMNARGKALSEFENFKAWLQGDTEKNNTAVPDGFWGNIDKKWTDLFWAFRPKKIYEIDDLYLRFFKSMAIFSIVEKTPANDVTEETKNIIRLLRVNDYFPVSQYEAYRCFDDKAFTLIMQVLNFVSFHYKDPSVNKIFSNLLFKPTYKNYLYFVTLVLFIRNQVGKSHHNILLQQWLRVTQNLIKNTTTENSFNAIYFLSRLSDGLDDLYPILIKELLATHKYSFFNKRQREEEYLKAKLIIENKHWETLLIPFEGHDYFYGQIGFLLQFSIKDKQYDQMLFKDYAEKAARLFADDFIETDDFLLQRALLSMGDYPLRLGRNRSFCIKKKGSVRDRNENWRKIFNNPKKSQFLKQLLDKISPNNIEKDLKTIISVAKTSDWRQLFIEHPFTFKYCRNRQVRFDRDDKDYLLSKQRMSSRHAELRTYIFYYYLEKHTPYTDFTLMDYLYISGSTYEPGISVSWGDHDYSIYYDNGKLEVYKVYDDEDKIYTGIIPPSLLKKISDFCIKIKD